ncbi:aspartate aminotransferase/aminotransferase [Shimia gijangensis]|uniref:aspartate transaminase n=1 Tax=Shimia gijangensis TaxID=1470563 RepID=A0A1M6QDJ6_9RHOB|nr:pyridoxal phosphate-dependent aminotransferase [Shimia gijangensis]SHK18147.1 aspartate aminotransferase/aminotransferase [Shimia gijangensis]
MTNHATSALISRRSAGLAMSAIKEMAVLSSNIPDAASLAWGLPSFRTPQAIRSATEIALRTDSKAGMYTLPAGPAELRSAAALDFAARFGRSVDPERNLVIGAGNMEATNTLLNVLLDPGDEVIVTDPGFVSHIQQISKCQGVPVFWPMDEAKGWELDTGVLPGLMGPRTKAIILVNPSNPTGRIFSEETLRATGEIARKNGLLVIMDDPYGHFVYDDPESLSNLASMPEYADNVAYLFTFSKVHAMSGWRVGYMVLPEMIRNEVVKIHDLNMICTPRISQIAAVAALRSETDHVAEFRAILGERRSLICERLDRLPHVFQYARPDGAYYVFPRVLVEHETSAEFAKGLLFNTKVAVTPGDAFGPSGRSHVRMAFCVDSDTINLSFDRLEERFGV